MTTAFRPGQDALLTVTVVAVKLAILVLAGSRYGYMSDELYFLDAARHPAAGYVDFPPLIAWLVAMLQALGLDSIFALRTTSALIGIAIVLLTVDLCRRLGGGRAACWITALVVLFAPGFASVQAILTMNVLDQLWWVAAFWSLAVFLREGDERAMLGLGAALGLGLLSKLSILALCAALPLAFLAWTPRLLARRVTWLAAGLALLVASPFLVWQVAEGFPFLDFIGAYNSNPPNAMVLQNPAFGLLLTMNPAYAAVWAPGAVYGLLVRDPAMRVLTTAAWLCLALFLLAGVKFYFAVPVFALFAAMGGLCWERWVVAPRRHPVMLAGLLALLLSGAATLPIAAPLLPAARLQQVADFLRDSEAGRPVGTPADLERYFPHFAEMHGWPELTELTARAWEAMPPDDRASAVLFASHYGQAGALNQLDRDDRLPVAHGRHMSYHLWSEGVPLDSGLFVGFEATELQPLFGRVEERGRLACQGCMSREQGLRLHYVAEPLRTSAEIRDALRRYDFF